MDAIRQHVVDDSHSTLNTDGFQRGTGGVAIGAAQRELVDDFVKVIVLLHFNTDLCMDTLRLTYNEYCHHKGRENWSVSKALEYYEGSCWFPPNRILLTGYLSAPDFMASIRLGMNTDPGAGANHGSFSHRFQWHVIMRLMTDGFSEAICRDQGWRHSPLELFQAYFDSADNVWGRSLDLQAHPGWGNPDNVLADLRRSDMLRFKSSLDHRTGRLLNRQRAVMDAIVDAIGANEITQNWAMAQGPDKIGQAVHIWKKTGGASAELQNRAANLIPWGPLERPDLVACRVWQRLRDNPETATFAVSSRGARYHSADGAPGVLTRVDATTDVTPETIRASRGNLNSTEYSMSDMGAQLRDHGASSVRH